MDTIKLVEEFHETFGAPVYVKPTLPTYNDAYDNFLKAMFWAISQYFKQSKNTSRSQLRMKLIFEEFKELCEAIEKGDYVAILDALTDLQVVLDGTYLEFGLGEVKDAAFVEVHRSNMSKLDTDGKPIYREDGKILKGPNFSEPDLQTIINNAQNGL